VYTQVIEAGQITDEPPPSPQFWGSKTTQSPPELGDLGGEKDLNEVSSDLCAHSSKIGGLGGRKMIYARGLLGS
jgi:hypothetical protein